MANPERGEVALTVGDRTYTYVLNSAALARLEGVLSTPERPVTWGEAFVAAARYSRTHLCAILWAGLKRHHPNVSMDDVHGLIDQIGSEDELFALFRKARGLAEPEESTARPRPARRSKKAGARTTSTPVASD